MDVIDAARRWAGVRERAWAAKDVEAIVASTPTVRCIGLWCAGSPSPGVAGVRAYQQRTFGDEDAVECHFDEPVAGGDRAAVEWWSSWTEGGHDLTSAGVTILRFDADGMVVDHRDFWNQLDRREPPFEGW